MTVYVDDANIAFRDTVMCHLSATTLEELHAMAQSIGLDLAWFQKDALVPHYNVWPSMKMRALEAGALEVDSNALLVMMVKHYRGSQ